MNRIHDVCAGVADGQFEPRWKQFHVPMGISSFLQHAMGILPLVCALGGVRGYEKCLFGA